MNWKLPRRMTLPLIAACLVLADCSSNNSSSTGPTTAFAVMRFTSAGVLDTTFAGGKGVAVTAINPGLFDFALAAAVQTDDKIIAGGSSGLAGSGVVALVRHNADGSLDTAGFGTAGTGGIVRTTVPGVTAASASAIAVQPGGKILVAALTFTASSNTTGIALIRYNANGTLDTTFGAAATGIVTAAIGQGLASDTCALALQNDGRIVVAGASQSGNIVLYRYNTNGTLDTAGFGDTGTGGSTTTNLGAGTAATSPALALQSTGKIVLVSGTNSDQVVIRYNTNGTLDNTFGATQTVPGIVVTDAGGTDFANAVAIMQDGSDKIVVAGHANVNFNADASDISLVRYTVDGALDTTFGATNTGIVTTDLGGKFDNAFSVALQSPSNPSTGILVSGNTGLGGFSQAVVLRYDSTGALDTTSFSQPLGYAIPPLFGPSNIASGNAVVLQSTLGIIVAGYD
jgi:uncharacterized delta-60 repeat protein